MGEGATTSADIPGVPMPFLNTDRRTRVRKRKGKRKQMGEEFVINEWRTRQVGDDRWEVKVGKKWVQGKWRTVAGHHVFFKGSGGMLPKKGIIARIKAALGIGGKAKPRKRSEGMESIKDVAARLQEADSGSKSASKQVIELIAVDAAESPKVQRRLKRLLGDEAESLAPELANALMPAINKWLETKGVRVQGSAAAEKALRTAAKE